MSDLANEKSYKTPSLKGKKQAFVTLCVSQTYKGQKYKALILKYKAHILKYVPYVFYDMPNVFSDIRKTKRFQHHKYKKSRHFLIECRDFYSIGFQPFLPNAFSLFAIVYGTGNKLQIVAEQLSVRVGKHVLETHVVSLVCFHKTAVNDITH